MFSPSVLLSCCQSPSRTPMVGPWWEAWRQRRELSKTDSCAACAAADFIMGCFHSRCLCNSSLPSMNDHECIYKIQYIKICWNMNMYVFVYVYIYIYTYVHSKYAFIAVNTTIGHHLFIANSLWNNAQGSGNWTLLYYRRSPEGESMIYLNSPEDGYLIRICQARSSKFEMLTLQYCIYYRNLRCKHVLGRHNTRWGLGSALGCTVGVHIFLEGLPWPKIKGLYLKNSLHLVA